MMNVGIAIFIMVGFIGGFVFGCFFQRSLDDDEPCPHCGNKKKWFRGQK